MTEPKPRSLEASSAEPTTPGGKAGRLGRPGKLLRGRDETTPLRLLGRVGLVVAAVFVLVCAAAYGLWTALN